MSKWNKPQKEVSQEFLQNEERRKQMIIEAAKRRKEKEKKTQQQAENAKRQAQEALLQHKKSKQQTYVKYLRNNMHDKYEGKKRQQQLLKPEIKPTSKWKSPVKDNQLQSLALEVDYQRKPKLPNNPQKKLLMDEFQKQWKDQNMQIQEMIGSQLIDSLDLDFQTLNRGKHLNRKLKKEKGNKNQEITEQIREIIGYQSVLFSIDERKNAKTNSDNVEKEKKQNKKGQQKPIVNEGQTFNMLKNQQEGKILNWAKEEVEEADELFSNCSSKKDKLLKEVNEQLRKDRLIKKQKLQPIPQKIKDENKNTKNTSLNKKISKQKYNSKEIRQRESVKSLQKKDENNNNNNNNNKSQEKYNNNNKSQEKYHKGLSKPQIPKSQARIRNLPNISNKNIGRDNSKQKKHQQIPQKAKTNSFAKPNKVYVDYSVATHQQKFQVESFIKNDLMNLNEEQKQIQEEIKNLHIANKHKIKEVQAKYQIKTDYKSSKQLIEQASSELNINNNYANLHKKVPEQNPTQLDVEESIARLDNLLMKRQIESRDRITEQSEFSSVNSIINPLSNPKDFQKQILQLAQNISRYENLKNKDNSKNLKQPEVGGYGYKNKMLKKKNVSEIPEEISVSKNMEDIKIEKLKQPPQFNYCNKVEEQDKDQEVPERIHVNPKLKNILLDD